ncbi:MAG: Crp/Fnr family transcriptional regulator, partial [Candidatus Kapaibacterium sp.]
TAFFSEAPYFVTEYVGFVTRTPARHSIVALEDSTVYEWTYDDLQAMYEANPRGERLGRLIAETVFAETTSLVDSYKLQSAADRYRDFVQQHPSLVQRVPQYMLASFLGITPESLSRIRSAK